MKTNSSKLLTTGKAWLVVIGITLFLCAVCGDSVHAQKKELDIIKGLMRFSDTPNSLYHEISKTAYRHLNDRSEKIQAIKSIDEWKSRQTVVRQTLAEVMGKFPDRTPLNVVITKTIQKDGYRIEHIVYKSQPQFYVTSSLFMPDKAVKALLAPRKLLIADMTDGNGSMSNIAGIEDFK